MLRALFALCLLLCLFLGGTALAQDVREPERDPDFTVESLRAELDALPSGSADAQPTPAPTAGAVTAEVERQRTLLRTAISRLQDAQAQEELRARYSTDMDAARRTLERLESELETLRAELAARTPMEADADVVGEAAMFATEQDLLAKESELATVQTELEQYRAQLAELGTRLTAAPRDLNAARTALGEVTSALTELGAADLDATGVASRRALQAREFYRRNQIAALEAEVASLPLRQEILSARRTLAELRAQALTEDVLALQSLTGRQRQAEAQGRVERARAQAEALADTHPLAASMAQDNVRLAQTIADMAAAEAETSRRLASVRGRTANVESDLESARKLIELEEIDREAGSTLRRLGTRLPGPAQLRADTRAIQGDLARVTRARVVAQEQLRDLPLTAAQPDEILARERMAGAELPELDQAARAAVAELAEQRRDLLRQTASAATARENALATLSAAQSELSASTTELRTLLDEKLIWVPSIPAVGLSWPGKVVRGALETFSVQHMRLAGSVLFAQARTLWPVVLIGLAMIALLVRMRPAIWADVEERAQYVGKVRKDSLWHTPAVIGAGLLMAAPWPIGFGMLWLLFDSSPDPDPLIGGIADGFYVLALLSALFVTWQFWDRDRSLFGVHFKLPKALREGIQSNIRWFLPTIGTLAFLQNVTSAQRGEDVVAGLSLAIFMAGALSMAVFAYRVLWRNRDRYGAVLGETNEGLARWRTPISLLVVGLPAFLALLAAAGWYSSARDLLDRVFLTGVLLLFTYVIYASLRRAITVAQRQIKYRQAVERREAAMRARREQAEAEARGEDGSAPPPPIDTEKIDVSAMTRQSAQLLRVIVLGGLALMLWFNWADLFPALTIFDGLEFARIQSGINPETNAPEFRRITLFTVIVALLIGAVTVVAARNLPGFLEIFVLNRLGVDAGARYAITTILGYIIIATGVVLAFQKVGLQWSQLRWVVTGLSVGIGFGLQKIIANFVSGLILLFERPIRIGDYVTIGSESGTVTRIKIRATTLQDLDNREILIPNENLISQEVTNWTLSNSTTRLICNVGIAYGSDTDRAREVMLGVVRANPKVLESPPPNVLFTNFGDSSLDFEVRAFLKAFEDRWPVKHALHTELNKALAEAGFEIPFPQRDLNLRGQDRPLAVKSEVRGTVAPPPRSLDYGDMTDPKAAE